MLENCPCHGCIPPKRTATCHPECKEYINWKEQLDALNEQIREQKRIDNLILEDIAKSKRKRK